MPFILRGVSLLGIDSVMAPKALREEAWARIATDLDAAKLASLSTTIGFDDIIESGARDSRRQDSRQRRGRHDEIGQIGTVRVQF
jgi:hypothetical protein